MNPRTQRAITYGRLSKDDDSLASHEARNVKYAQSRPFEIVEQYSDPDTSGGIPFLERDGSRAAMNRLQHGDVGNLIVCTTDRLGRDTSDGLLTLQELDRLGVVLHVADEGGDNYSSMGYWGRFFITLRLAFATVELCVIKDRFRKKAQYQFDRGLLTGKCPYGYDVEYTFTDGHKHLSDRALRFRTGKLRCPEADLNGKKALKEAQPEAEATLLAAAHGPLLGNRLLDNPAEQRWIHWLNDQRLAGLSFDRIATTLNELGVTTKLGRPWQCGSVHGVLNSRHTARLLSSSSSQLAA